MSFRWFSDGQSCKSSAYSVGSRLHSSFGHLDKIWGCEKFLVPLIVAFNFNILWYDLTAVFVRAVVFDEVGLIEMDMSVRRDLFTVLVCESTWWLHRRISLLAPIDLHSPPHWHSISREHAHNRSPPRSHSIIMWACSRSPFASLLLFRVNFSHRHKRKLNISKNMCFCVSYQYPANIYIMQHLWFSSNNTYHQRLQNLFSSVLFCYNVYYVVFANIWFCYNVYYVVSAHFFE